MVGYKSKPRTTSALEKVNFRKKDIKKVILEKKNTVAAKLKKRQNPYKAKKKEAEGNEYHIVDAASNFLNEDYPEEYWANVMENGLEAKDIESSKNLILEAWFSLGTLIGAAFQVLFLETNDSLGTVTVVLIFCLNVGNNKKTYALCTSKNCRHMHDNLSFYCRNIDNNDIFANDCVNNFCDHFDIAARYVLEGNGCINVIEKRNDLCRMLAEILPALDENPIGFYISDIPFKKKGLPCVFISSSYSATVLCYWNSMLWCHGCRKGRKNPCRHIQNVIEDIDEGVYGNVMELLRTQYNEKSQIDNFYNNGSRYGISNINAMDEFSKVYLFSTQQRSFSDSFFTKNAYERTRNFSKWLSDTFEESCELKKIDVHPECAYCSKCKMGLQMSRKGTSATLFAQRLIEVNVFTTKCVNSDCELLGTVINYDGYRHGLVNFKNVALIAIELVEEYGRLYASGGLAINAWWEQKCSNYALHSLYAPKILSLKQTKERRGMMSTAICGTAELIQMKQIFKCCQYPRVVSLDGIVLSTLRSAMPKFQAPWIIEEIEITRASNRTERQFPALTNEEKMLFNSYVTFSKGCSALYISNVFEKTKNSGLRLLLLLKERNGKQDSLYNCPSSVKPFAKFLSASIAPVTSLIPYDYWQDVHDVVEQKESTCDDTMRNLLQNAPVIYSIVLLIFWQSNVERKEKLWNAFKIFFIEAEELKKNVFKYKESDIYHDVNEEDLSDISSAMQFKHNSNSELNELFFFFFFSQDFVY
jgi:hypothetical protein